MPLCRLRAMKLHPVPPMVAEGLFLLASGLSSRNEISRFLFPPLGTARGYRWRDSVNRRRLTLNRRRLADDQLQSLAGWRSAEVRVYRMPAVCLFL